MLFVGGVPSTERNLVTTDTHVSVGATTRLKLLSDLLEADEKGSVETL